MNYFSSPRAWLLASLLLLPLMITNDSLWLDEGDTAIKYVAQPDFHSWWNAVLHDGGSDSEMPLADFCYWAGGRLVGTHEWQLRSLNLVWGALGLVALGLAGRRLQLPWLPLLLAIQPFFWFYQDQARPYALQMALGGWLLFAFVEFHAAKAVGQLWAWILAVAGFLLFCATMLAPLSVLALVLAGGWTVGRRGWKLERRAVMILFGGVLACVPVGIYYLTALLRGAKGAQVWQVDWKSFGYVIYELTGLFGLGLPSDAMRELGHSAHFLSEMFSHAAEFALPALGAGLLLGALFLGWRRRTTESAMIINGLLLVLIIATGEFFVASLLLKKAFWARHLSAIFPFYATLLGLTFAGLWATARPQLRALPLALCGLLVLSGLNLRFAPQWRKEDYRSAAAFAHWALAEHLTVWWQAGGYPANYYGLECAHFYPEPGKVFTAYLSRVDIRSLPLPDVVLLNKPDLHDPFGTVQKLVSENPYVAAARYQGFLVWVKSTKNPN